MAPPAALQLPEVPSRPSFDDPALYLNRELSLLAFNVRVLAQARDLSTPLLERLRFLCISSTNLDEFFEIRVAGLKQRVAFDVARAGPDGLSPLDTLRRISEEARALVDEQYRVLNEEILPALASEGVRVLKRAAWNEAQRLWVADYFHTQVLPVLTPMGIDPAHPFPNVLNKSLNFIVALEGTDAFGRDSGVAVVQVPRCLPRIVGLPSALSDQPYDIVLISSVVHAHIDQLFPGMRVVGCHQFRVTRNSDLFVDEEEIDNLLAALKGELPRRNYGAAVRLEVADNCQARAARFLLDRVKLSNQDLYQVNGPVNLHRLSALYDLVERPDLKYPPFLAGAPSGLTPKSDLLEVIRQDDVLLHHPYQSFGPVVELLWQAAEDPAVLAIKQTLYRTGPDSPIVDALIAAARAGKDVTAVVELRARFDEAANIRWATRLEEAGANVVYGVVGYKTHAKMLLIVRREGSQLRRYVHLGTGNYHSRTARAYTDLGFMTCRDDFGRDVHALFMQLTGLGRVVTLEKLLQSPFTLHERLIALIEAEAGHARAGRPARLVARMNALVEPRRIQALYAASQDGVRVDLIVRGPCRLRPGVPGVSDNIRVVSIVGRFLEHARAFWFSAGGRDLVFLSSADWMERNFFRRVETCWPIEDAGVKRRVIDEALRSILDDNTQAWVLQADGSYAAPDRGGAMPRTAQEELMEELGG